MDSPLRWTISFSRGSNIKHILQHNNTTTQSHTACIKLSITNQPTHHSCKPTVPTHTKYHKAFNGMPIIMILISIIITIVIIIRVITVVILSKVINLNIYNMIQYKMSLYNKCTTTTSYPYYPQYSNSNNNVLWIIITIIIVGVVIIVMIIIIHTLCINT